ncbi:MAG TPA: carboxypeptidase regulatory-like domain-containing protein [Candidatus Binataceae bacterium]|nr:carboxypeptidase regulatory-like domain-containing protein [Candidatus Binataceae bacterium]
MAKRAIRRLAIWLCVTGLLLPHGRVLAAEAIAARGGTITGIVKLDGAIPNLRPPEIIKSANVCESVPNETLVVGPEKGIRYAVITLEGVPAEDAGGKEAPHELDNVGCRFVPHVQAMEINQSLVLKNTDHILHSDHAIFHGDQPQFNVGLYGGKVVRKPMVNAGVVKIECDVHPWMSAYVIVTENPYYAVSDEHGEYKISGVPAGKYHLKIWHERLGTQEKDVVVTDHGTAKVNFAYAGVKEVRR